MFILCSFVLAGTLWITPEASYCLDALTAHLGKPRHNPLQTTQPYRIFPARPTHSFLSHTGPATSAEFLCFCFLFCFFTQSGTTDTDLPPDGPENHILNRRARGNLTTRYLQQTRVSRIFQPIPLQYGPAPWKPSFSVYYFVSLPFPIFLLSNPRTPEARGSEHDWW